MSDYIIIHILYYILAYIQQNGDASLENYEDPVEIETCKRKASDEWLFVTDCTICWIKYCTINLLYGKQITLRFAIRFFPNWFFVHLLHIYMQIYYS